MKAWDYNAVVYDDEVFCVGCLPEDPGSEFVSPIFASDEWDHKPICCVCGKAHDYMGLTIEYPLNEDATNAEW